MLTLRLSVIAVCSALLSACGTAPPPHKNIPAAGDLATAPQAPRYITQPPRQQANVQFNNQQQRWQQQHALEAQRQDEALRMLSQQRREREQAQQEAAARQQQQLAMQQQAAQEARDQQRQRMQRIQQHVNTPPAISSYEQQQNRPVAQFAVGHMYTGPGRFTRLPDQVVGTLRASGVSEAGMGTYVRLANGSQPALLTANADNPQSPASTMKLVTTYAALGVLGPDYRWPTEIYTNGNVTGGTLYGDVIIRGYGNPQFAENDFRQMLQALRARGINSIKGNLVADTGFFNVPYQDPGAFDGNAGAAYNAQPEAILYQERGSCYEFTDLKGKIQKVCPILPSNAQARQALNVNLFGSFWKMWVGEMGGQMQGTFARGGTPQNAQLVYTHRSRPLREIIMEVNKDSNNVMARQILLSVGAKQLGAPGTPQKGAQAIGQWLESRGLAFPELRLENGSGLSRIEQITPRHMGEMLVDAYNSPYREDLLNSMAVLGVDGTLKNRMKNSSLAGRGRFKTGTLRDVRALAGYLQASDGQMYVISILHNDPRARASVRAAHDDLVEWVYAGPRSFGY
ncbi:MAG TPA: D-alanyl-D-alanine carboxypeptidase/D-alanyl-D-alanine-endopeptidase [Thiolinea sp.]|nr:D-alanyl-D-alanine carboxypeptidase/D-alanyl-D-alanine-endopeptidase [Thiolinea sp.]